MIADTNVLSECVTVAQWHQAEEATPQTAAYIHLLIDV